MPTNTLAIWNIALTALGERSLSSTAEEREPQRLLDEVWTRGGGAIAYLLEQGLWDHAMTRSSINNSTTVTPAFGFANAHLLPTDFVRLAQISADVDFADPIIRYEREGGHIFADSTTIFLRYVSDSTSYGNDLALWPETFTLWTGYWLATQLAPRLKNENDYRLLKEQTDDLLVSARLQDTAQSRRPWPPVTFDQLDHRELDYGVALMARHSTREEKP